MSLLPNRSAKTSHLKVYVSNGADSSFDFPFTPDVTPMPDVLEEARRRLLTHRDVIDDNQQGANTTTSAAPSTVLQQDVCFALSSTFLSAAMDSESSLPQEGDVIYAESTTEGHLSCLLRKVKTMDSKCSVRDIRFAKLQSYHALKGIQLEFCPSVQSIQVGIEHEGMVTLDPNDFQGKAPEDITVDRLKQWARDKYPTNAEYELSVDGKLTDEGQGSKTIRQILSQSRLLACQSAAKLVLKTPTTFYVTIKNPVGLTYRVHIEIHRTIEYLKEQIELQLGTSLEKQQFVSNDGRLLYDGRTLSDYKVSKGSTLLLMLNLRGGMFHATSARQDFAKLDGIVKSVHPKDLISVNVILSSGDSQTIKIPSSRASCGSSFHHVAYLRGVVASLFKKKELEGTLVHVQREKQLLAESLLDKEMEKEQAIRSQQASGGTADTDRLLSEVENQISSLRISLYEASQKEKCIRTDILNCAPGEEKNV